MTAHPDNLVKDRPAVYASNRFLDRVKKVLSDIDHAMILTNESTSLRPDTSKQAETDEQTECA
jgi:hypothetical protein